MRDLMINKDHKDRSVILAKCTMYSIQIGGFRCAKYGSLTGRY